MNLIWNFPIQDIFQTLLYSFIFADLFKQCYKKIKVQQLFSELSLSLSLPPDTLSNCFFPFLAIIYYLIMPLLLYYYLFVPIAKWCVCFTFLMAVEYASRHQRVLSLLLKYRIEDGGIRRVQNIKMACQVVQNRHSNTLKAVRNSVYKQEGEFVIVGSSWLRELRSKKI